MDCAKDDFFDGWDKELNKIVDLNRRKSRRFSYRREIKNNKIIMILLTLGLICGIINIVLIIEFIKLL